MSIIKFLADRVFSMSGVLVLTIVLTGSVALNGCSKGDKDASEKKAGPGVEQAPEVADQAKVHHDNCVQHLLKGEHDQAIAECEKSLAINPNSASTHNNIGFAYYDMGDFDKAVEHQRKALEMNPKLANGYYGLAQALEKKGENEEALKNWKEFRGLSEPHSKWWMKANEHITALEKK